MGGIKRKSATPAQTDIKAKTKKAKVEKPSTKHSAKHDVAHRPKTSKKPKIKDDSDELVESDTSEDDNGFNGFAANKEAGGSTSEDEDSEVAAKVDSSEDSEPKQKRSKQKSQEEYKTSALAALNGTFNSLP
jgi:pumilio family protein 6